MKQMQPIALMYKHLVLGLCLMTALTILSGCSSAPSPEQQRSLVPYRLSGSKDGWEISCDVREMTAEEKRTLMDTLKQDWAKEEALLSASGISREDHAKLKEAQEEMLRDLEEKDAYLSSISVLCNDRELEGKSVTIPLPLSVQ